MKKSLIAMAAGMGSRFGGLKQAAKFGSSQKTMLDFSLEDAMSAGFSKAVFVIRKDIEDIFRESVSGKYENLLDVEYVFQEQSGAKLPAGRTKPWGTGHAVLACANKIDEPFLAVNADDFYGASVYAQSAEFLDKAAPHSHALAGYRLGNTLSKNGGVSRGICAADENLFLIDVRERTGLKLDEASGKIVSDSGESFSASEFTSLNFWSFNADFMDRLGRYFDEFMSKNSKDSKAEFYLPHAVGRAVSEGAATAKILPTDEIWQGVTYREDMDTAEEFFKKISRI